MRQEMRIEANDRKAGMGLRELHAATQWAMDLHCDTLVRVVLGFRGQVQAVVFARTTEEE